MFKNYFLLFGSKGNLFSVIVEGEDEMFEVGQDFAFMVNIPFHFIEYNPYVSVSA